MSRTLMLGAIGVIALGNVAFGSGWECTQDNAKGHRIYVYNHTHNNTRTPAVFVHAFGTGTLYAVKGESNIGYSTLKDLQTIFSKNQYDINNNQVYTVNLVSTVKGANQQQQQQQQLTTQEQQQFQQQQQQLQAQAQDDLQAMQQGQQQDVAQQQQAQQIVTQQQAQQQKAAQTTAVRLVINGNPWAAGDKLDRHQERAGRLQVSTDGKTWKSYATLSCSYYKQPIAGSEKQRQQQQQQQQQQQD